MTAYRNKIRVNLLQDTKNIIYEGKLGLYSSNNLGKQKNLYKGVNPNSVKGLTSSIGAIYQNYGSDPLEKIIVLGFCLLACSQFMIEKSDYLWIAIESVMPFLTNLFK